MAYFLSPVGGAAAQFFDNNGTPLAGGKLFSYAAGTTTPLTTYTSNSGSTPHANPIILDAAGRVSGGSEIWLLEAEQYKFVLKTNNDTLIATWDNISGSGSPAFAAYTPSANSLLAPGPLTISQALNQITNSTTGSSVVGFKQAGLNAVPRTSESKMRDIISVLDYGADRTGLNDSSAAVQAAIDALPLGGGLIIWPTGTYLIRDINIINRESVSFDFRDSVINLNASAQYAFKLQNTVAEFKKGGVWQNVTFGSGTATTAIILVDGGAWANQVFDRVFANSVTAPALIQYTNSTAELRNPSNFRFNQVWNRSFSVKYLFHYQAAAVTTGVDNFYFKNLLHYTSVANGSTIHWDGAGCLYSRIENVYCGHFAAGGGVVTTSATNVNIIRSYIDALLLEGTGSNRACLSGAVSETQINHCVNFVDTSVYSGNAAINVRSNACDYFSCILQNSVNGAYSTQPSVILDADSKNNRLQQCYTVTDNGFRNFIFRGKNDYITSQNYQKTYVANTVASVVSFRFADFLENDVIKVFVAGTGSGNTKVVEFLESGVRSLITIPGGITNENWSLEVTYQVFTLAGVKSLSPHIRVFRGTTCVVNEFKTPVSFPLVLDLLLNVTASSWSGTTLEMRTAYAAPLFNSPSTA